jgi:transposase
MPPPHPPEFRRRAVELARERSKPIAQIAVDIGISESCLGNRLDGTDIAKGRKGELATAEREGRLHHQKRRAALRQGGIGRLWAIVARLSPASVLGLRRCAVALLRSVGGAAGDNRACAGRRGRRSQWRAAVQREVRRPRATRDSAYSAASWRSSPPWASESFIM